MPRRTFSVDLDDETAAAFDELVASHAGGNAELILEQLIAFYVMRENAPDGHEEWMREQIEEAIREADAPGAVTYSHEEVMAEMRQIVEERFATVGKLAS